MIFIRHNHLQAPYDDYNKLSIEELDKLALGIISPPIQDITSLKSISDNVIKAMKQGNRFICSDSQRTKQTCMQIQSILNIQSSIEIDSRLNEIIFSPISILGADIDQPLTKIRPALYKHIRHNGIYADSKEELDIRISSLINDYKDTNTVLFSHGFFMRLVNAYQKNNNDIDKALVNIEETSPVDYIGHVLMSEL